MHVTNVLIVLLVGLRSFACAAEIIKVLVVLVQWANHDDRALIPREEIDQMWNGPSNSDVVPGESISDYFNSNTYGKYTIEADVVDWYRVTQTEQEASNGNMGNSVDGNNIEDVLLPALEAAAETYDLSDYTNEQGELWGIVFVHSGYAAENGGTDCETGAEYLDRIISKAWGVNVGTGDVRLLSFTTLSAYKNFCNLQIDGIGKHVHEWLHSKFGLLDLYDLGGRYNNSKYATGGIGAFGIMSFAGGQKYKEEYPGILTPFHKIVLEALDPIEITADGTYTARASALYPDVYKIHDMYPPGEYLLIENRQPVLSDLNLWEPGGIVIYKIDENEEGNYNRGGPFVEGWPGNGAHYQVAVLQADGLYELEMALNLGGIGDFWKEGDVLGPGNGELVATEFGTYPNTDSYQGGNIEVTGLVIDQFNETESGVWSFRVKNVAPSKAPTTLSQEPTPQPSPAPVRCPQYSSPVFAEDESFECNCVDDCITMQDLFCNCDAAEACCDAYLYASSTPSMSPVVPEPSMKPSANPSLSPSSSPSSDPSTIPSMRPSIQPSMLPTVEASSQPTAMESFAPSVPVFVETEESSAGAKVGTALIVLTALGAIGYLVYLQIKSKSGPQIDDAYPFKQSGPKITDEDFRDEA